MRSASAAGLLLRALLATRTGRAVLWATEGAILPGVALHFALRKLAIEGAAREAIAAGTRRVVVLGAGFDSLALRLCREGVGCTEVDHPDTQRLKIATAKRLHAANLPEFVAADLARGVPHEALAGPGPSLFIAEGLLMYVPPAGVESLLRELASAPPGSTLIFTFLRPRPDGRLGFRRSGWFVKAWLRRHGEPFQWGDTPEGVRAQLARLGWKVVSIVESDGLQALAPGVLAAWGPLAAGECVCIAKLTFANP